MSQDRTTHARSAVPLQDRGREAARGVAAAVAAFAVWGLLPLYYRPLHAVSALQVIAQRIVWSCIVVIGFIALRRQLGEVRAALVARPILLRLLLSATLVSLNWLVYVWAVLNGHVVEASLGYFINPLVNVLLGIVFLAERLNRAQWTAVLLASAGVAYLTFVTGHPPWISLTLAFSFAGYGFVRKVIAVEALPGLAVETLLLLPLAGAYLLWCEASGSGAFGHAGLATDALLVASGPVTAIPLFLFAYGARRIPYSALGLLQYIAPSLQLACAVLVLHEPFKRTHAAGFALIWAALIVYAGDGLRRAR
jgi:chloramphenicol-sensitive protein RarD